MSDTRYLQNGLIAPRPAPRPVTLAPGSRRHTAAQLLARPQGATALDLLAVFGFPPEAKLMLLHTRLSRLSRDLGRPIERRGRGRWAIYRFLNS